MATAFSADFILSFTECNYKQWENGSCHEISKISDSCAFAIRGEKTPRRKKLPCGGFGLCHSSPSCAQCDLSAITHRAGKACKSERQPLLLQPTCFKRHNVDFSIVFICSLRLTLHKHSMSSLEVSSDFAKYEQPASEQSDRSDVFCGAPYSSFWPVSPSDWAFGFSNRFHSDCHQLSAIIHQTVREYTFFPSDLCDSQDLCDRA